MQSCNKNGFRLFTSVQNVFVFATVAQADIAKICVKLFFSTFCETKFTAI